MVNTHLTINLIQFIWPKKRKSIIYCAKVVLVSLLCIYLFIVIFMVCFCACVCARAQGAGLSQRLTWSNARDISVSVTYPSWIPSFTVEKHQHSNPGKATSEAGSDVSFWESRR